MQQKLWQEYIYGKQTAKQLANKYGKSRQWISQQLNQVKVKNDLITHIAPGPIVVVVDATFFTRNYGILIFWEPNKKINLA